jgi:hypothetical protein
LAVPTVYRNIANWDKFTAACILYDPPEPTPNNPNAAMGARKTRLLRTREREQCHFFRYCSLSMVVLAFRVYAVSIFTAQALSSAVPDRGSTALMVKTLVGTRSGKL